MRLIVSLPVAIALTLTLAATDLGAQGGPPLVIDEPVLRPGDAIGITVWRKPDLSGEFKVAADGTIADPFYMGIQAAGVPFPTVVEQVRNHIAQFEASPRVFVEPLMRVSIGGEVRDPNLYLLRPETTVEQAVMEAGGPTERGRRDRILVLRGSERYVMDMNRAWDETARMQVRSGDQILVTRQVSIVRDYIAPFSSIMSAVVSLAYLTGRYF